MRLALVFLVPLFCRRVFFTDQSEIVPCSTYFSCLSLWGRLTPTCDLFCGSGPLGSSVCSTDFLNGLIFPDMGKRGQCNCRKITGGPPPGHTPSPTGLCCCDGVQLWGHHTSVSGRLGENHWVTPGCRMSLATVGKGSSCLGLGSWLHLRI